MCSDLRARTSVWNSFFFQAEDGIRDYKVNGVQTCALPISPISRVGEGVVELNAAGRIGVERRREVEARRRRVVDGRVLDPAVGDPDVAARPGVVRERRV